MAERADGDEPYRRDGEIHASASVHDWPDLHVTHATSALEATSSRAQQPARPGLIVGPVRSPSMLAPASRTLLPASILGITDIKVKGTLTDTEPGQAQI
jgi:hypothetical protein